MPATPYLRVDISRLRANIRRAAGNADATGVRLRPHVKTHKTRRDRPAAAGRGCGRNQRRHDR